MRHPPRPGVISTTVVRGTACTIFRGLFSPSGQIQNARKAACRAVIFAFKKGAPGESLQLHAAHRWWPFAVLPVHEP